MKSPTRALLLVLLSATLARGANAQTPSAEKGAWRALSNTARSITGDLILSGEKISINFATFPLAEIRELTPAELAAAFHADASAPAGSGTLYRLSIPAAKYFLHHNTLCGSEETQWIATFVSGKTLQLAMFSGASMPVLTPEAISNSTALCGTYSYTR